MSIEFPEANILARQMNWELKGKRVADSELRNCQKLQKIRFVNTNTSDFARLARSKIESVTSRGNVVLLKMDNAMNLILAPEYGGKILYHPGGNVVPKEFHLKVCFSDDTALTVALTGMGIIQALKDDELEKSYVYRRDFSQTPAPIGEKFKFDQFSNGLSSKTVNIKSLIVGKDALVVGLGNSAFQDIIYRAKIHPKRKSSELVDAEKRGLFEALAFVIQERIRAGGKTQFQDLYGKQGTYVPAMGPNMKNRDCPTCQTPVKMLSLGGGQVFYCPICQT